ncbi:MAG: hypothetical protein IPK73_23260 [Candidatus Obscuribacter sp.]|nr:hypothetical protein [Candidatus Obscuribacter sp.]MBK9277033.1 hypothetical protein [Candidatus Obscuribacter sp.]
MLVEWAREVVVRGRVVLLQVLVQVTRRIMAGRRAPQAHPIRTQVLRGRRAVGRLELREVLERRVSALVLEPGGLLVQELDEHPRRE